MSYDPLSYWEDRAESWIEEKHDTQADWDWIKEFIKPEWEVLELGCGTGRFAPYFYLYEGWDISPKMVEFARSQHPDKLFEVHGTAGELPYHDLIFTWSNLQHVTRKEFAKLKFPDTNLLFIEPHIPSGVEHCYRHDYESLGVKRIKSTDIISVWSNL